MNIEVFIFRQSYQEKYIQQKIHQSKKMKNLITYIIFLTAIGVEAFPRLFREMGNSQSDYFPHISNIKISDGPNGDTESFFPYFRQKDVSNIILGNEIVDEEIFLTTPTMVQIPAVPMPKINHKRVDSKRRRQKFRNRLFNLYHRQAGVQSKRQFG